MGVLARSLSIICSLFHLQVGFSLATDPSRLGGNETDRLALLAIKAQIEYDPLRVMSSWNESTHFCQWHGITCSRQHQRVTMLDLQSQQLAGSISPHIGNLSFLRVMRFQNNSFSHEIPPEIGHLRRLRILQLNNNSISGEIPANISGCSNLININFGRNRLVGKIPTELGSLSKLRIIILQVNNLTGEIPPWFGNLSSLEILGLTLNNFIGRIPNSLGQLTNLTHFLLGTNRLSGTIPSSIYNLSGIINFSVIENQIQGSFPQDLGNTLPNLQFFSVAINQFTGSIPVSISNASNIVSLHFTINKLTGQVPTLRKLHKLRDFHVSGNHLGSEEAGDLSFLSDLTNATGLELLYLDSNNFGGMLPTSICNFSTKLSRIAVAENQIYGSIPTGMGNLVNLEQIYMENNLFTGDIPTDIGNLQKLGRLYLHNNKLSGNIPPSLGNLKMLIELVLQGNNLQGSIPSSLGNCQRLLILDLSDNSLSGAIPPQVIGLSSLSIYLDLGANQLTGSLPMEVGNLKNLGALSVSNNLLSGKIPTSLGSCESLEVLHLQGNFFHGTIPPSLMSLRGIQELDLSRNNLSGEIPQYFEGFAILQNLNLSFNDFVGVVPVGGVFKNASETSIVGNNKLCGGMPELQLPRCNFKESKKKRLTRTLKLIISTVSGLLGITLVLSFLFLCSLRKKSKEPASSTSGNSILQVSYISLFKATDGFSSANLTGVGSFGSVYKGILDHDGTIIAVKVFNLLRRGASKSFLAECEALRNIRHRNLVKIITACSSVDLRGNDFKALVYEFMVNGSLEEWLHPTTGIEEALEAPLNLLKRLNIAIDVACALDYLHHRCQTPIVHCDLKPSNVLLDNEMTGHVADFGLARFLSELTNNSSRNQTSSIGIRGSVGYTAPEYGMGSEVSTYGDVYSYGILLLEMFTGKRPTDDMFNDSLNLHNFVKMAFLERVTEIVDLLLLQGGEEGETSTSTNNTPNQCSVRTQKIEECLTSIFRIGIACSAESPRERMDISVVAAELHSIRDTLLGIGMHEDRPTTSTL